MAGARSIIGLRLLVLLAGLLFPTFALAHATLVGSSPGEGAVVSDAPQSLSLDFNEPVSVASLRLTGGGRTVVLDRVGVDGASIKVEAPSDLPPGSYALSYRAVSGDGHPIAGAVSFVVGAPGAGSAPQLDPTDVTLDAAIWTARFALYVALLVGAGGSFALAWIVDGAGGRRIVLAAVALGLAAAPIALALLGADLMGTPVGGALDPAVWRQAFVTSYAWTIAAALGTLVAALISLVGRGALAKASSAVALGGVGAALAASGHASAASPQILMRAAVSVHAIAAAFWIGALVPLLLALRSDRAAADRSLLRFSATAPYAVASLVVAGVVLAVRQVETVPALWTTNYGLVLSAKLALVTALVALAAVNRWRWTRASLAGAAGAPRSLRHAIVAELIIGAFILGVVALWRFTPPPRSLALASAEPALAHLQTRTAQADVTLSPGRVGTADLSILVMTGDFGPLDAKELTVVLSNPAAGVEGIRREARKPGDGTWRINGVQIPAAGRWTVRIEMLVTDFDIERLEGRIDVRR